MNKLPLLSIITVCYNAENTIGAALNSVVKQSYSNVELIVIDGGSTDGTLSAINEYSSYIAKFVSERDEGIYDAMNKGLIHSNGDYVAFLNADDYYSNENVLSDVVDIILSDGFDIVTGDVAYFKMQSPGKIARTYKSVGLSERMISFGLIPAHPAFFARRNILINLGGFNTSYKIAGDFDLMARIAIEGKYNLGHIPSILVKMQSGGASSFSLKNFLLVNKEILRSCKTNNIRTSMAKITLRYLKKLFELRWF